jgi:hypothetical protein
MASKKSGSQRRRALFEAGQRPIQIAEPYFNPLEPAVHLIEATVEIIESPIDQDGQRHLNKRLLDEARRIQPAS